MRRKILVVNVCFDADLVLSNKLFVYDLEKKTLGWTQYDCEYSYSKFVFCVSCSNFLFYFEFNTMVDFQVLPTLR